MMSTATFKDNVELIRVCAKIAHDLADDVDFKEAQLADEEVFMFFNFPVHSNPTDEEVVARFEELLDEVSAHGSLANAMVRCIEQRISLL